MVSKRKRRPARRRPAPVELPMTQAPWPEAQHSGFSPILVIAIALFAGALLWALLPGRKPAPPQAAPASRDSLPPARQAAPASAQPTAVRPQAAATKPIQRAAAGKPVGAGLVPARSKPTARANDASVAVPIAAPAPASAAPKASKSSLSARAWRAEGQTAELAVFGPRNKRVRVLRSEAGPAGWIKLDWDAKDEAGVKVPQGLYYLRPSAPGEQTVQEAWVD